MSKSLPKNNQEVSNLNAEFQKAFNKISKYKKAVAPDVMLKLYAFYKQANFGNNFSFNSATGIRSAFKFNAWMQLNGMSSEEAKKEYIELANKILTEQKQKK